MNKNTALYLLPLLFVVFLSCKQSKQISRVSYNIDETRASFRIMFYNVENLFDTENDPTKNDNEFTTEGSRYWLKYRFNTKLKQIYKVIVAVGGWDLPEIIGLCEIENRFVLEELINKTPLYTSDYKIIHYESPDNRGIDVGLFYRESRFTPINHRPIPVIFPSHLSTRPTRDILYVHGHTYQFDTLHIFVNHWPSRWGGQMETEALRMFCGNLLRKTTDSISRANPRANIIIIGDFNDYPKDRSLTESLKAKTDFSKINPKSLYNLSHHLQENKGIGTHRYEGIWGVLDQIIVSGALLDKMNNLYTSKDNIHIFSADWLLEKDEKYGGLKTYRTYIGFKYHGGFSDHLPTYVDILKKNN